ASAAAQPTAGAARLPAAEPAARAAQSPADEPSAGAAQPADALAVLARLFVLAEPVAQAELTAALGAELSAALEAGGLLRTAPGPGAEPTVNPHTDAPNTGFPNTDDPSTDAPTTGAPHTGAPAHLGEQKDTDPAHTSAAPGVRTAGEGRLLASTLELRPLDIPVGVPRGFRPGDGTVFLLSDHGTLNSPDPVAGDFVLGLGGAGRTLAAITPRARTGVAADLGCGCGIQALLLARHCGHVIATDVSERALALTGLNAELNGAANIETRLGSLFDPIEEAVDLLVSNPPFVITPQGATAALSYRDGGMSGDALVRALVAGAPEVLGPDGHACFLLNWEVGSSELGGVRSTPEVWAADPHTSAMVIERERVDPARYAETWIRDGGVARASARWEADTAAWLDDFAARGVTAIAFGWMRLHRVDAAPPARNHTVAGGTGDNPAGLAAHLDTRLALLEWLAGASDAEVAAASFVRAGDVVEVRRFVPGEEAPAHLALEQGAGLAQSFAADAALAGFLGVADGTLTLDATAQALAELLGADPAALRAQLIAQVRELVPAGFAYPQA
ncbi:methyltransferase, partial [Brevibacterium sp. 5221]